MLYQMKEFLTLVKVFFFFFSHFVFIEKEQEKSEKYLNFRKNNKRLEKILMSLAKLWEFNLQSNHL